MKYECWEYFERRRQGASDKLYTQQQLPRGQRRSQCGGRELSVSCICVCIMFVIVLVLGFICPCLCIVQAPKANGGVFGGESCSSYSPGQWASPPYSLLLALGLESSPLRCIQELHLWRRQIANDIEQNPGPRTNCPGFVQYHWQSVGDMWSAVHVQEFKLSRAGHQS